MTFTLGLADPININVHGVNFFVTNNLNPIINIYFLDNIKTLATIHVN